MNTRLYVGNLSFHTTEETLMQSFAQFGAVAEVKLMLDRDTGNSRGFAFVSMADADGARKAIAEMNGALLDGRPLRVNEAEERRERTGGGGGFGGPRGGGGFGGGGGRGGPRGGGGGGGGSRDNNRRQRWLSPAPG
jgi:RNA recognition motif-containing protein